MLSTSNLSAAELSQHRNLIKQSITHATREKNKITGKQTKTQASSNPNVQKLKKEITCFQTQLKYYLDN